MVAEGEKIGRLALRYLIFLPVLLQILPIFVQLLQMVLYLLLQYLLLSLFLGLHNLYNGVVVMVLAGLGNASGLGDANAGRSYCEDRGRGNQGFCHFFDVFDGRVDSHSFAVVGSFGFFLFIAFSVKLLFAEVRLFVLTSINIYLSTFNGSHTARINLRLHHHFTHFFLLFFSRLFHNRFCQIVGLGSETVRPLRFALRRVFVIVQHLYALLEDNF